MKKKDIFNGMIKDKTNCVILDPWVPEQEQSYNVISGAKKTKYNHKGYDFLISLKGGSCVGMDDSDPTATIMILHNFNTKSKGK